ncbi:MAG: hypothetical protein ACE5F6_03110 [Anaerolineae bacterium]
MTHKRTVVALFLLMVLTLGAPTARTAPANSIQASPAMYLPLVLHNTFEPVIAFASYRDGNFEIYAVNPRSLTVRNITRHDGDDMAPAFGPRGLLAWASTRDGNWEIYAGDVFGRNIRRLTFDSHIDYGPTWSPGGSRIAFSSDRSGNMDIWSLNADGSGGLVQLTNEPSQQRQPAWSPDGNQIAYVSDEDGNDNIYVRNADGSGKVLVKDLASSNEQFPAWSPDGQWIIFTTDMDGKQQLYAFNVNQQTLQPVMAEPIFDVEGTWNANGKRVALRSTRDGNTDIYVVSFDGTGLGTGLRRLTTHEADDIQPAWSR